MGGAPSLIRSTRTSARPLCFSRAEKAWEIRGGGLSAICVRGQVDGRGRCGEPRRVGAVERGLAGDGRGGGPDHGLEMSVELCRYRGVRARESRELEKMPRAEGRCESD